MKKMYYYTLLCVFIAWPTFAQRDTQLPGACPSKAVPLQHFNELQFLGNWYEHRRYPNSLISGQCGIATYTKTNNRTVGFTVKFVSTNLANKKNNTQTLNLKKSVNDSIAKYEVHVGSKKENIPQYVLDTDYKSFAVVWGCYSNSTNNSTQRLSIFSKKNTIDSRTLNNAIDLLKRYNISVDSRYMQTVEQNDKKCGRKGKGGSGGGGGGGGSGGGGGNNGMEIVPGLLSYAAIILIIKELWKITF